MTEIRQNQTLAMKRSLEEEKLAPCLIRLKFFNLSENHEFSANISAQRVSFYDWMSVLDAILRAN